MSFYALTALLAASIAVASPIETRDGNQFAIVSLYSDSSCSNFVDGGHAVYGQGDLGCWKTNNAVGVQVKGQGCKTAYYATEDCNPEYAFLVPNSGCYANVKAFTINCD